MSGRPTPRVQSRTPAPQVLGISNEGREMSCICEKPVENINPRNAGHCVKCSRELNPEWTSSDANLGEFFERLAEATFPAYGRSLDRKTIPQWFFNFYRECSGRERAGRKKFGLE